MCEHTLCKNLYVRIKIAILREEKGRFYLVVCKESQSGKYGILGGHPEKVDKGCYLRTLARELNEEIGITVHNFKKFTFNGKMLLSTFGSTYNKTLILYVIWKNFDPYYYNEVIFKMHTREIERLSEIDISTKRTPENGVLAISTVASKALLSAGFIADALK